MMQISCYLNSLLNRLVRGAIIIITAYINHLVCMLTSVLWPSKVWLN